MKKNLSQIWTTLLGLHIAETFFFSLSLFSPPSCNKNVESHDLLSTNLNDSARPAQPLVETRLFIQCGPGDTASDGREKKITRSELKAHVVAAASV